MDVAAMNVRIMFQKNEMVSDAIGNHENVWTDYYSCHATVSDSQGKSSVNRRRRGRPWHTRTSALRCASARRQRLWIPRVSASCGTAAFMTF